MCKKYNSTVTWYSAPLCHGLIFSQIPVTFGKRHSCVIIWSPQKIRKQACFCFLNPFPHVLTGFSTCQRRSELMFLHKWTHRGSIRWKKNKKLSFSFILHLNSHLLSSNMTFSIQKGQENTIKELYFVTRLWGFTDDLRNTRFPELQDFKKKITVRLSFRMKYICFPKKNSHIKCFQPLKTVSSFLDCGL